MNFRSLKNGCSTLKNSRRKMQFSLQSTLIGSDRTSRPQKFNFFEFALRNEYSLSKRPNVDCTFPEML